MDSDELRRTASGYISAEVARGRFACATIIAEMVEYLHGYGDPDDLRALGWRLVEEPFAAHLAAQATWPSRTDSDRLTDAFRALDVAGIVAREDFACCQNCGTTEIGSEVLDTDEARGYVFYHGQDAEHAAAGGGLWLAYGSFGETRVTEVGDEVAAALRAEGLHVDWDGTSGRRIHVRLGWARRRHGRMAAYTTNDPAGPAATVEVIRGRHQLSERMSANTLAKLELPWLPSAVVLRIEVGGHSAVIHRQHDRLVSDDGRSVGRFDGLRLVNGENDADGIREPALLEVTFVSSPTGPVEIAGRPMILPEVVDTLRRLPTRTDSWLSAVGRGGDVVQVRWELGRLWLETPHPEDGAATGKYASLMEAEQMFAILATEDRSAVAELDGATTRPWR